MNNYGLIYADPPWEFTDKKTGGGYKSGAAQKYKVMGIEAIKQLPVPDIAAKDAILVMWWVGSQPQEALDLTKHWGFTLKNMNGFVWNKLTSTGQLPYFGMGRYTRAGSESALIATRGKPAIIDHSIRAVGTYPIMKHSEKPSEFREKAARLVGGVSRLEMFARTQTPGWDVFGNEVKNSIALEVA